MTLGVIPQALVGDSVPVVTALVERLKVTQDVGESNPMKPSTAQKDRDTAQVQQLIGEAAHRLITTDPTAWFPAIEIGPHGFSRPCHRGHQKEVVAQRLHAKCSAHAEDRQWVGPDTAVLRRDEESQPSR